MEFEELITDGESYQGNQINSSGLAILNSTTCHSSLLQISHNGMVRICNDSSLNESNKEFNLPREMIFTDDSLVSVIAYSVLFFIAAIGNLSVFVTLFRFRHRKSRVNLFIMHLCMADMIVTFVMLPMEIGWHLTVSWLAGDFGCRLMMFFRAFGFYLSSFVLIAISIDRYLAIAHPLSLTDPSRRSKMMLLMSWLLSAIASAPQSVIFHQEEHPEYHWYKQCITFNFFPSPTHELAYNLFNVIMLYVLPLLVIIVTYSLILFELTKRTRESNRNAYSSKAGTVKFTNRTSSRDRHKNLRSTGPATIEKARSRTLKLTVVIVAVFIICWTPYFVISALWWFDKDLAAQINPKLARGLFIFAVSNSCMNPIVYGMFTRAFQRETTKLYNRVSYAMSQHMTIHNWRSIPKESLPSGGVNNIDLNHRADVSPVIAQKNGFVIINGHNSCKL